MLLCRFNDAFLHGGMAREVGEGSTKGLLSYCSAQCYPLGISSPSSVLHHCLLSCASLVLTSVQSAAEQTCQPHFMLGNYPIRWYLLHIPLFCWGRMLPPSHTFQKGEAKWKIVPLIIPFSLMFVILTNVSLCARFIQYSVLLGFLSKH